MLDEETMNKLIAKAALNPEFRKVFEQFLKWSQEDPSLQDMVKNMAMIGKLGLDIVDD